MEHLERQTFANGQVVQDGDYVAVWSRKNPILIRYRYTKALQSQAYSRARTPREEPELSSRIYLLANERQAANEDPKEKDASEEY